MRPTIAFVIAVFLFGGDMAQAAVNPVPNGAHGTTRVGSLLFEAIGPAVVVVVPPSTPPRSVSHRRLPSRPSLLIPLYTTFAGLQVLDIDSTINALRGPGREANPLMRSIVGSTAGLLALKAGTTAGVIFAAERLRKDHHPVMAVVLMIGVNSMYAMVVTHNYSVANGR